jgi:UPF0755 protein
MKKKIILGVLGILLLAMGMLAWKFLGSATAFIEKARYIYIPSDKPEREAVMEKIRENNIVSSPSSFEWLASRLGYWKQVKPGRYEVKKGDNLYGLIRRMRNGSQSPVNLVITKLRTREDLAGKIGKLFECDSVSFLRYLNDADSLRIFGLDTNTVMTAIIPNTYNIYWNTPANRIFRKLYNESKKFWTEERKKKAEEKGLSPEQAYILASIVEEETNNKEDKGKIASAYLNRIAKGMPLQADPTVIFAMRGFGMKRVLKEHLRFVSPYNTYLNRGLPPGPICTPSINTIDAALNAPVTDYIYFVASSDFSGRSEFTADYKQHLINARRYQLALDSLLKSKR